MDEFVVVMVVVGLIVAAMVWVLCSGTSAPKKKTERQSGKKTSTFFTIRDQYDTLPQIQDGLRKAGLESSQLLVAVDFTRSNLDQGRRTFGGKSLHFISPDARNLNPYEKVIQLIGKTLSPFDDDQLIPAYGFGDSHTKGKSCFPFNYDEAPLKGFEAVLLRYREIAQNVSLSGPTNFAPVIDKAVEIVKETGEYHVLLIVCDGQVSNRQETEEAIVKASNFPLAIVIVGVGDGPWDDMKTFDDELPARRVDNLQFVDSAQYLDYNSVGEQSDPAREARFAVAALQELPEHYQQCRKLKLM